MKIRKRTTKNDPNEIAAFEELFAREYLKDLNATQALARCGRKYKTNAVARQIAMRTLAKVNVESIIQRLLAEKSQKIEIDVETVLRGLHDFAMVNPVDAFNLDGTLKNIHEMPVSLQKSISSVEIDEIWEMQDDEDNPRRRHKVQVGETKKIRFWDKPKGLELLGKYLAMFVERNRFEDKNGDALPSVQVTFVGVAPAEAMAAENPLRF